MPSWTRCPRSARSICVKKPSVRVSAAEKRRSELLARAEKRRDEIANELQNSQERLSAARVFTRKYDGISVERAESQSFWNDLLLVFGINRRAVGAEFERVTRRSDTGGTGRIDVLWPGILLAEHKSLGKDFTTALAQADAYELEDHEKPRLTVVCDFARFFIRDNHTGRSVEFALSDLPDYLGWFGPLLHNELADLAPQRPVDVNAAEKMADLHDSLRAAGYEGHALRVLMTRLLFCFFADDARIWAHGKLDGYLRSAPPQFAGPAIAQLFEVLNTPPDKRSTLLPDNLTTFPYVNGGLFAEALPITNLSPELLDLLIATSEEVDWVAVSPAVFGAMFQGVMDATERHNLGAHYTSEENILRLIEPLFLDELYQDIEDANTVPALERIWQRMAAMRVLDPAAGCGNFLVVSYRELRRVERHLMEKLRGLAKEDPRHYSKYPWVTGQRYLDSSAASRMHVGQFNGIEIDEWPAQIAQVAMWLTDHLANLELEEQFGGQQTRLPLTDTANITVGNALRIDWNTAVVGGHATHLLGNPPFLGHAMRSKEQNEDMAAVWGKTRGAGSLDYVACWFKKAVDYIDGTDSRIAFVSTNSISQGEQPATLWAYLFAKDIHIDFAHRSFNWTNEAKGKAAVHVIITGLSQGQKPTKKRLWSYPDTNGLGTLKEVDAINAYLTAGPEVLVANRRTPLSPGSLPMSFGSMPNDGGHLILTDAEAEALRVSDADASQFLRQFVGAAELIQGRSRWCLWLANATPNDIRASTIVASRVGAVRATRAASTRASTRELASTPALFGENRQPTSRYLAVPGVSSERREYVPMAFLGPEVIASNALLTVEEADLTTFGIFSSRAFNCWNAAVSGRLESRFRISAEVTYNNFPWPAIDDKQKAAIELAAQAVLDARAAHPASTLADLYDPLAMPARLVKAHKELDKAVLAAYGLKPSVSDGELLAELFRRYAELLEPKT